MKQQTKDNILLLFVAFMAFIPFLFIEAFKEIRQALKNERPPE